MHVVDNDVNKDERSMVVVSPRESPFVTSSSSSGRQISTSFVNNG